MDYRRPIAVCVSIVIGERFAGDVSCLSLRPAGSVCAVLEPVLPHIDYQDIATASVAAASVDGHRQSFILTAASGRDLSRIKARQFFKVYKVCTPFPAPRAAVGVAEKWEE
jgi:hypothetical protein